MAALIAVALPAAILLTTGSHTVLEGFGDAAPSGNQLALDLLEGEQLVPPPSLPPEVFTTSEVQLIRPALAGANRDWSLLVPEFQRRLLLVFRRMQTQFGYQMVLLEGYRSPQRQDSLAQAGSSVTNARAFQSFHQYGLAADCAFYQDGKLVISEKNPWAARGYQLYGALAETAGLTWGGHWTMMDLGHVEWRNRVQPTRAVGR